MCLISLIIREMHFKNIVKCHYILPRTTKTKRSTILYIVENGEQLELSEHFSWECKIIHLFYKKVLHTLVYMYLLVQ